MPAASRVPVGVTWDYAITGLNRWAGVVEDIKTKQLQDAADKVTWATYNHLGVQLFVSYLKPAIHDELMKNPPTDLKQAITQACGNEKINSKPDNVAGDITEITGQEVGDPIDEEIAALSAQVQALKAKCMGQFPTSRGGRGGQNGREG